MEFKPSTRKNKKYMVRNPDGKLIHFGDKRYQHYKDTTGLGVYSALDHGDSERRKKYKTRHAKTLVKKYTPSWYSWNYLWGGDDV